MIKLCQWGSFRQHPQRMIAIFAFTLDLTNSGLRRTRPLWPFSIGEIPQVFLSPLPLVGLDEVSETMLLAATIRVWRSFQSNPQKKFDCPRFALASPTRKLIIDGTNRAVSSYVNSPLFKKLAPKETDTLGSACPRRPHEREKNKNAKYTDHAETQSDFTIYCAQEPDVIIGLFQYRHQAGPPEKYLPQDAATNPRIQCGAMHCWQPVRVWCVVQKLDSVISLNANRALALP